MLPRFGCRRYIYTRQGITLDCATLAGWVRRAVWWLKPLHEHLIAEIVGSEKIFADDTPVPVLDPGPRARRDRPALGLSLGRLTLAGASDAGGRLSPHARPSPIPDDSAFEIVTRSPNRYSNARNRGSSGLTLATEVHLGNVG